MGSSTRTRSFAVAVLLLPALAAWVVVGRCADRRPEPAAGDARGERGSLESVDAGGHMTAVAVAPIPDRVPTGRQKDAREPGAVAAPAAGATLSVLVSHAGTGLPLAGYRVEAVSRLGGRSAALSDAGGRARLERIPFGTYEITVRDPSGVLLAHRMLRVDLPGSEIMVELRVWPAARLSGTVVDRAGNPLAGARVRARAVIEDVWRVWDTERPTGEDGRYSIAVGGAEVISGFLSATCEGWHGDPMSCRFTARSGERVEVDPIVMVRSGVVLRGRLIDSTGEPLAGARCRLVPRSNRGPDAARPVETAEDGSFAFVVESPGDVRVLVEGRCTDPASSGVDLTSAPPGSEVDMGVVWVFPEAWTLSLRVLFEDGEPVAGAAVWAQGRQALTDAEGRCRLPLCTPGPVDVAVHWTDPDNPALWLSEVVEAVTVASGERIVRLHRRGFELELRGPDGSPVQVDHLELTIEAAGGGDREGEVEATSATDFHPRAGPRVRFDAESFAGREVVVTLSREGRTLARLPLRIPPDLKTALTVVPVTIRPP